ncbi:MAG: transcriptional repressor NrdR [Clostridia bacterium]|jgi:transcriptional repressor NrdR|nr:transcriptional repressor NrdR [Clostridia bacterium]MBO7361239.1 transcriptional repressor NrdR [Clostridia bacterium]MCR4683335.1 transcriptional regulator NrdR [Clostridiales bacterium]
MRCPSCGCLESRVIDSRQNIEGNNIKRRRECIQCQKRFTTFEVIESVQIVVVKKNGSKELFDKSKLLGGIMKACQKRPVNAETIANEIESELQNSLRHEVTSGDIGEMVMRKLKDADDVAYVRFASVYREFKDIETFIRELNSIKEDFN